MVGVKFHVCPQVNTAQKEIAQKRIKVRGFMSLKLYKLVIYVSVCCVKVEKNCECQNIILILHILEKQKTNYA